MEFVIVNEEKIKEVIPLIPLPKNIARIIAEYACNEIGVLKQRKRGKCDMMRELLKGCNLPPGLLFK